jgi:hypothetical protein
MKTQLEAMIFSFSIKKTQDHSWEKSGAAIYTTEDLETNGCCLRGVFFNMVFILH